MTKSKDNTLLWIGVFFLLLFMLGLYWGASKVGQLLQKVGAVGAAITAAVALPGVLAKTAAAVAGKTFLSALKALAKLVVLWPVLIAAAIWGFLFGSGLFSWLFNWITPSDNPPGGDDADSNFQDDVQSVTSGVGTSSSITGNPSQYDSTQGPGNYVTVGGDSDNPAF